MVDDALTVLVAFSQVLKLAWRESPEFFGGQADLNPGVRPKAEPELLSRLGLLYAAAVVAAVVSRLRKKSVTADMMDSK